MITVRQSGSFDNMNKFLKRVINGDIWKSLDKFGSDGVRALSQATPKDESITAQSWSYQIVKKPGYIRLSWHNDHMAGNVPVAVLIQYGHATGNGGYIEGRDYINPALRPIFDKMADEIWKEVTR